MRAVERLAGEGFGKGEIVERLGFNNPATFDSRLVRASQHTGKPIPAFKARSSRSRAGGAGPSNGRRAAPAARREEPAAEAAPRQPRLVKGRRGR